MKSGSTSDRPEQDQALRWSMRVVGIVLAISSIVFMNQDIFTSDLSWWFFGLCIGLGLTTTITSWLPDTKTRLREQPAVQPIRHRTNHYRKAA